MNQLFIAVRFLSLELFRVPRGDRDALCWRPLLGRHTLYSMCLSIRRPTFDGITRNCYSAPLSSEKHLIAASFLIENNRDLLRLPFEEIQALNIRR